MALHGVEVRVDETDKPDSVIFSAERFDLTYDFRSLVAGDLSATVIRAIDPHVYRAEIDDAGAQRALAAAVTAGDGPAAEVLAAALLARTLEAMTP